LVASLRYFRPRLKLGKGISGRYCQREATCNESEIPVNWPQTTCNITEIPPWQLAALFSLLY
jgi:hypothetical protein